MEIKLNHSALVTLVRNFFWEVPCHHNKENICKLADACEKKDTSYNTALRLWKVPNDTIETGFYSKVETAKQRSKSSFWRAETSKQPAILRCMPSNQRLFFHCSFWANHHQDMSNMFVFFTICLHFNRPRSSIVGLNLDRQSFSQETFALFGSVFDEISHDSPLN